jgi:UDP:flavonoid glycosyltransferase YjiC (YdhE family)
MKFLAMPNAHALAHVTRLLEIGKVLKDRGHEIAFAGSGKYLPVAAKEGFATHELPYISARQVVEAVRSQRLWTLYPEAQLKEFLEAELALYHELGPDAILIDNRPTARTSAQLAELPTVAVLNVHMSIHKRFPFFSLSHRNEFERIPGIALVDRVENYLECLLYDLLVMRGLNRIRHRRGLTRLFSYQHEEGDLTLFADIPEFSPVSKLPDSARFIGPLTWHNNLPAPECLANLDPNRPVVYFTLGSEGLEELLRHLDAAVKEGLQIVVALGGAPAPADIEIPDGVYLEDFINTDRLLPLCDLVCCHGGNGTLYQALALGLPTVVVATHEEQLYGGKRVQRMGLGLTLTLKSVRRTGMTTVVERILEILHDVSYRERARAFSKYLRRVDPSTTAADAIEQFMA